MSHLNVSPNGKKRKEEQLLRGLRESKELNDRIIINDSPFHCTRYDVIVHFCKLTSCPDHRRCNRPQSAE